MYMTFFGRKGLVDFSVPFIVAMLLVLCSWIVSDKKKWMNWIIKGLMCLPCWVWFCSIFGLKVPRFLFLFCCGWSDLGGNEGSWLIWVWFDWFWCMKYNDGWFNVDAELEYTLFLYSNRTIRLMLRLVRCSKSKESWAFYMLVCFTCVLVLM